MTGEFVINGIAYREGDVWVIQGVEYDILARAKDPAELPDAFARAIVHNLCALEAEGKDLTKLRPAPVHFRDLFERARTTINTLDGLLEEKLRGAHMGIRLIGAAA